MTIEFYQNGVRRVLKTPRKIIHSEVSVKNNKNAIVLTIRKHYCPIELKKAKLKLLGEFLITDRINLSTYYQSKNRVKKRTKKVFVVKIAKDKNSLVKIQRELFEDENAFFK